MAAKAPAHSHCTISGAPVQTVHNEPKQVNSKRTTGLKSTRKKRRKLSKSAAGLLTHLSKLVTNGGPDWSNRTPGGNPQWSQFIVQHETMPMQHCVRSAQYSQMSGKHKLLTANCSRSVPFIGAFIDSQGPLNLLTQIRILLLHRYDAGESIQSLNEVEQPDPFILFNVVCGVLAEDASLQQKLMYNVKQCCFWSSLCVLGTSTCPCWCPVVFCKSEHKAEPRQ